MVSGSDSLALSGLKLRIPILGDSLVRRPQAPGFLNEAACSKVPPIRISFGKQVSYFLKNLSTEPSDESLWISDLAPHQTPDFHLQVVMAYVPAAGPTDAVRSKFISGDASNLTAADLAGCDFMAFPEFADANFNDTAKFVIVHRHSISKQVSDAVALAAADSKIRMEL